MFEYQISDPAHKVAGWCQVHLRGNWSLQGHLGKSTLTVRDDYDNELAREKYS